MMDQISRKGFRELKRHNNLRMGVIDVDPQEEIPILAVGDDEGSYLVFPHPDSTERLRVLYVTSKGDHSMSEMLDWVVSVWNQDLIRFFTVISKDLIEKVDGEQTEYTLPSGEKTRCVDCQWDQNS